MSGPAPGLTRLADPHPLIYDSSTDAAGIAAHRHPLYAPHPSSPGYATHPYPPSPGLTSHPPHSSMSHAVTPITPQSSTASYQFSDYAAEPSTTCPHDDTTAATTLDSPHRPLDVQHSMVTQKLPRPSPHDLQGTPASLELPSGPSASDLIGPNSPHGVMTRSRAQKQTTTQGQPLAKTENLLPTAPSNTQAASRRRGRPPVPRVPKATAVTPASAPKRNRANGDDVPTEAPPSRRRKSGAVPNLELSLIQPPGPAGPQSARLPANPNPLFPTDSTLHQPPGSARLMPDLIPRGPPQTAQAPASAYRPLVTNPRPAAAPRKAARPAEVPAAPASCDNAEGHYILNQGEIFGDHYRIVRQLGQGTFGRVVECDDVRTGAKVAVKIIRAIPKYHEAALQEIRVLKRIRDSDPTNAYRCVHLRSHFEFKRHMCMVFDLMGLSVFDYLKGNGFHAFPMHHIQDFTVQLIKAVAFLHRMSLIHTDLKPENILLMSTDHVLKPSYRDRSRTMKVLKDTTIRLIDFGSATFNSEFHSSVVSTRHYRAPEIIMGMGWSYPCDMWSIGCILMELFSGDALFQTHDNAEHLAMMERVLGKLPVNMIQQASPTARKMFNRYDLVYPTAETKPAGMENCRQMKPLPELLGQAASSPAAVFYDLVGRLLSLDPAKRLTAEQALKHPFLFNPVDDQGNLRPMAPEPPGSPPRPVAVPLPPTTPSAYPLPAAQPYPTTPRNRPPFALAGLNASALLPYPDVASPSLFWRSQLPSLMQTPYGRSAVGAPSPLFPPGSVHYMGNPGGSGNMYDTATVDTGGYPHQHPYHQPASPYGGLPMNAIRSADFPLASQYTPMSMQSANSHPAPESAPYSPLLGRHPQIDSGGRHPFSIPSVGLRVSPARTRGYPPASPYYPPGYPTGLLAERAYDESDRLNGGYSASRTEYPTTQPGHTYVSNQAVEPPLALSQSRRGSIGGPAEAGSPRTTAFAAPLPPPSPHHSGALSPLSRFQQVHMRRPPMGASLRRPNRPSPLAGIGATHSVDHHTSRSSSGSHQQPLPQAQTTTWTDGTESTVPSPAGPGHLRTLSLGQRTAPSTADMAGHTPAFSRTHPHGPGSAASGYGPANATTPASRPHEYGHVVSPHRPTFSGPPLGSASAFAAAPFYSPGQAFYPSPHQQQQSSFPSAHLPGVETGPPALQGYGDFATTPGLPSPRFAPGGGGGSYGSHPGYGSLADGQQQPPHTPSTGAHLAMLASTAGGSYYPTSSAAPYSGGDPHGYPASQQPPYS